MFDQQDSGNVSYGVEANGERWFVKTAGDPADARPFLDHAARVALLRNAARLAASCTHPALTRLRDAIESPSGPLLVYDWFDGELVGAPRARRDDPASAFQRFRRLPAATITRALETIFDLHVALGWIASDFYDGCLLYDFATGELRVMDLDSYRDAPFVNDMGRMFGSTRFMAPEEFERGAAIDERTTVFNLGRAAFVFLGERDGFRGTPAQLAAATRACEPDPARRFQTAAELTAAFYSPSAA